jgi:hypothetical protein
MKKILQLSILLISYYTIAQPIISWQKCIGGATADESGQSIIKTNDGGSIFTGSAVTNNGDVSGNHGSGDVWVVKQSSSGVIQWQKCLGGSGAEFGTSIIQTNDGGYMVTGSTTSNNGDVSGNHGNEDVWVVKLSSIGLIEWQKCLGGSNKDNSFSIIQTSGGGYILTGITSSNDGDVSGNHGSTSSNDVWVVKLSSIGAIEWQKCLGGFGRDFGQSINKTTDGGYILTGWTNSINDDVSGLHGGYDIWVVKLSSLGIIEWKKCLGGSGDENGQSISQTLDGGYILTGYTTSNNGDVSGVHGDVESWVVKLSSVGIIEWQKCLGGSAAEFPREIKQTTDGGYILIGRTTSNDGDVNGNHGGDDVWVVKLSNLGLIQWQKCFGGSAGEQGLSITQSLDGEYILTGWTGSNNGDVSGNHGGGFFDAWVLKFSSFLGLDESQFNGLLTLYPNPTSGILNLNVKDYLVNKTYIISDVEGKLIMKGKLNGENSTINVEHLSKGVYLFKVSGYSTRKFIKE